jgi:hypothetical protein
MGQAILPQGFEPQKIQSISHEFLLEMGFVKSQGAAPEDPPRFIHGFVSEIRHFRR